MSLETKALDDCPILTIANFAGQWPGLVGLLGLNAGPEMIFDGVKVSIRPQDRSSRVAGGCRMTTGPITLTVGWIGRHTPPVPESMVATLR